MFVMKKGNLPQATELIIILKGLNIRLYSVKCEILQNM